MMMMKSSILLFALLAPQSANAFGPATPLQVPRYNNNNNNNAAATTTTTTMRVGGSDLGRRQQVKKILNKVHTTATTAGGTSSEAAAAAAKDILQQELLSDATAALLQKCHWKLRRALTHKIRALTHRYDDVEFPAGFGQPPTQAQREAVERAQGLERRTVRAQRFAEINAARDRRVAERAAAELLAKEQAARAEQRRIEREVAAAAKKAEEERLAAEAKAAEEARIAAEAKAAEEAAAAKKAEEERLAAEAKAAEEARLAAEAKAAEEAAAAAAAAQKAEEERLAAAAKAAEEAAAAQKADEERIAAEAKAAEEAAANKAQEEAAAAAAKKEEDEKLAAEAQAAEAAAAEGDVEESVAETVADTPVEESQPAAAPVVAVTPALIKELREATGAGMMDCKKALLEEDGDMEAAAEFLRKKGLAKADKKAARVAAEGRIAFATADNKAVLVEINCETDFVGKDAGFVGYCDQVAQAAISVDGDDMEALMSTSTGEDGTVEEVRQKMVAKIGENIQVRRMSSRGGADSTVGAYIHMNRIGVLVEIEGGTEELCTDIAMHVAAMNPPYATPEDVPGDVVEKEKKILSEQALESGKPAEIVEKMVAGRIRKYLEEICLVSQNYVKDGDITVGKLLEKNGAKMIGFTRVAVGEGIEKKEGDFAAEVAKMAGQEPVAAA